MFSAKVRASTTSASASVSTSSPEGFETVGGYLLARLGRVPAVGETFELDGLQVEVLEAERRLYPQGPLPQAAALPRPAITR